ncbi:MAG: Fe-S cluster assembly ATPase SufC [Bdellovibrionaceae bacterium]|nr:Fe-S cluster assembly ATPase SufC [Pseudobdellovibrionaceae bacterium]
MLKVTNLHASINDKEILTGLNLSVQAGEVHCIMGPNGAGKSTLSKILTKHPDYSVNSGQIEYTLNFEKYDLLNMEANERSLNGVFLALQHPVEITGISNFQFLQEITKAHCLHQGVKPPSSDELKKMILDLAKQLKLPSDFLDRSINDGFSGGEKKRNEVLQMLLLKPQLIFLDELDSGLDIDGLHLVAKAIKNFQNSERAFVLVTHYQSILKEIKPDFVHVLHGGKLVKSGDYSLAEKIAAQGYSWLT